jgi:hypothetical protein
MSVHVAVRPAWTCVGCGQPRPCLTRQRELFAEYGRSQVSLALYLSSCLVEATRDLPFTDAGQLYSRFIGWLRR